MLLFLFLAFVVYCVIWWGVKLHKASTVVNQRALEVAAQRGDARAIAKLREQQAAATLAQYNAQQRTKR